MGEDNLSLKNGNLTGKEEISLDDIIYYGKEISLEVLELYWRKGD